MTPADRSLLAEIERMLMNVDDGTITIRQAVEYLRIVAARVRAAS